MVIISHLIAFLCCVGSAIYACKMALLTDKKYFGPLCIAFIYASGLRFSILLINLNIDFVFSKNDIQTIFVLFYVLCFVGWAILYHGYKNTIGK